MNRYLDPTNDTLFKKIFGDAERVKEFLNNILNLPDEYKIRDIEFIPTEALANINKGRKSFFDLKVKDNSGNRYIIEMQKKGETDYLKRVQYYSAHSYVQQIKAGSKHIELLPILVISLLKTKMFPSDVPCISFHKTLETSTNKQYMFDISYVFIELGKFDKEQLATVTDEWLHLFKCAEEEKELPGNITSDKVRDAYHTIEMHNLTPEEYDAYVRAKLSEDAEEIAMKEQFAEGLAKGEARGKAKGLAEGEARGEAKERVKIAKLTLAKGRDIKEIAEFTELSVKEIKTLKAELKLH